MALPKIVPVIPGLSPTGTKAVGSATKKAGDVAVKDERVHASQLIAQETGWRGNDATIARAVMGGESSYNTNAENFCCVGLMQVNAQVWKGKFGLPADEAEARKVLKANPRLNLRVAYKIWQNAGGSWQPWEAFTNGSYKKFIGQDPLITVDKNSVQGAVGDAVSGAVDAVAAPFNAAADVVNALFSPSAWARVGKGALGGAFIILGTGALVFIVANKAASTPVGKTAVKAIK